VYRWIVSSVDSAQAQTLCYSCIDGCTDQFNENKAANHSRQLVNEFKSHERKAPETTISSSCAGFFWLSASVPSMRPEHVDASYQLIDSFKIT
jgi:hypothetical protein